MWIVVSIVLGAIAVIAVIRARRTISVATRQVEGLTRSIGGPSSTGGELDLATALVRLQRAVEPSQTPGARVRQSARLEAALSTTTQGVIVTAETGNVVFQNPFAASFTEGRHSNVVVGDAIEAVLAEALTGDVIEREVQLYGPPPRTLYVSAQPLYQSQGLTGAVVLIDDVTDRQRLEAMRRDFVANISHELRTPVGAMSLLAETIADERDPALIASLGERIQAEAERMANTIEDLLELSRIEHADDQEQLVVELQTPIREAADAVLAAADQKQIDLGVVLPEESLLILGDHRQLRTAVFNLVENAVKYCDVGGVVSVRGRLRDDMVVVDVQDDGTGIPRRDLDRIFERFYRVDRSRTRAKGGTGLGLSIVRHVVANHGGRVRVESIEGEGSTFTMEFPAIRDQGYDGSSDADASHDRAVEPSHDAANDDAHHDG